MGQAVAVRERLVVAGRFLDFFLKILGYAYLCTFAIPIERSHYGKHGKERRGAARRKEKAQNPLEHNLTPGFLSLGVLISLVYFLFEGEIFRLLLRSQGYRISVVEGLKNALLGLYYSYITPSSTGGQPMQSAYLLRDNKIPAGISTAVLIVKFMCFQCAFVLVSVVSFIGMYGKTTPPSSPLLCWDW